MGRPSHVGDASFAARSLLHILELEVHEGVIKRHQDCWKEDKRD